MRVRRWLVVVGLWLLAAAQYFWITPQLLRLSADYADETSFTTHTKFRDTPTGAWSNSSLTGRRVDQTLLTSASHAIIQGDTHYTNDAGVVEFETTGIYGVDRYTRMNLPGYGSDSRTGSFLFPRRTERKTYRYWDPMFIGSRVATFTRADTVDGVPVYVFRFTVTALDESAGYRHMADVPERYRAHTDAHGTLWIEPATGIVVDYEDQGASYFVDPASAKRVAYFYTWTDRYTPQTKATKLQQAAAARRHISALEIWAPLGLLLAGLVWLAVGLKSKPPSERQEAHQTTSTATGEPP